MSLPDFNHELVLEEAVRLPDGAGGYALGWQPLGTLWAALRAGTGAARGGEAVTLASVPYKVVVRAAPVGSPRRPKPAQRFRDGTRVFGILAVADDDPQGRTLTCFVREEVAA
ncbi:head-tail adaptor [Rhodobacter aestuarii]|uniref:Head-tail adaptor n=1 Tax=Rhodobacter aestuarii TaxID=453582 RepID=A0A1N7J641_9RHOB|nr:head-tail adaptor protein [Rhodobacter aestuarii]PTV97142.1 head-tail adaptor [Rhodobacter aestuarii]SIS44774.1 head-tail adaptor [Rhodobacter aestuarii]